MKKLLYILFICIGFATFAQQKQIEAYTDSTKIKIGSQFHLYLKAKADTASVVHFPKEQFFGALEVLEEYPTDTIVDKNNRAKFELIKKYGLTQFDSGRYVIPQLKVFINNKPFLTDSLYIEVNPVQVDTLKQPLFDIKDVIAAEGSTSSKIWLWILISIAILGLAGFGVYHYLRKRKTTPKELQVIYTPIEKATINLKQLEEKNLIEKGAVKEYYSELTDITRTYIQEAVKFPAMENTTDELLENLKRTAIRRKLAFSDEMITSLEKVLRQADLVKFAKSKPLEFEIIEDRNAVEKTLRTMHGAIPLKTPEEEEAERNEELRLELERKRKRKKLISNLSFVGAIVVVIGMAYWMATSGITTIKDKLFGSSTSELVTAEWVTSEYGNPPIKMETPKVLKRMDTSTMIADELKPAFKNIAVFGDGAIFGDYTVMASTMQFTTPEGQEDISSKIDLGMLLEGMYALWEAQGAKNILMQKQEYTTPTGTEGMKAFGTLDYINPLTKKSNKFYYEILVFKQRDIMQQVITVFKESDPNKNEIIDRIISSVELGQLR